MPKTVVLIDDEDDVRENTRDLLVACGFTVVTAANGREGLELLASVEGPCFVLLDLLMPGMDGWEFLRELDKDPILSKLPVYVCTSVPERAPSGRPVMRKPVDVPTLLDEIRCHC